MMINKPTIKTTLSIALISSLGACTSPVKESTSTNTATQPVATVAKQEVAGSEVLSPILQEALRLNDKGVEYLYAGKYPQALEALQKSLKIKKTELDEHHSAIATSYNNLGGVYEAMGDYSQALSYHQKALAIWKKVLGENHPDTATSYNNIGGVYDSMGDYSQALSYYQKALAIRKKVLGENHHVTAASYNNIGSVYKAMGDYPQALSYHQKALAILKKIYGENHRDTALSYNNIGEVYRAMGDYPQALSNHQKALAILKKVLGENQRDTAASYNNIGLVYDAIGDYPQALSNYQKALAILKKVLGENQRDTAASYNNIGLVYDAIGDYPQALSNYQKALAILKKVLGENHRDTAASYNNIGLVYDAMGDYPQALSNYQKALAIMKKVLDENHPDMAKSYHNIALLYNNMGKHSQAYQSIKNAFSNYLNNRKIVFAGLNNQQKMAYLKANDHYINGLLGITTEYMRDLLKQGNQARFGQVLQETLNSWLAYKGSIIDSEMQLLSFAQTTKNPKVKQQYQELIALQKRYAKLAQAVPQHNQKAAWQEQVKQLSQEKTQLQYQIAKQDPRYKAVADKQQKKVTAKQIAQLLKSDELYMDFAWVGDNYYIFTISREGTKFNSISSDNSKTINSLIEAFNKHNQRLIDHKKNISKEEMIQLKRGAKNILGKLYKLLISDTGLNNNLENKDHLIISPDGALRLLPFEALYNKADEQYLVEQKDIRYISSGRELVRAVEQRNLHAKSPQAVIFANPDFGQAAGHSGKNVDLSAMEEVLVKSTTRSLPQGLLPAPQLSGTQDEADKIKSILTPSPREYLGKNANEAQLFKVKSPKILHIATHGFFTANSVDPMLQSGLLLANANTSPANNSDEGIVTALKLSTRIDLKGTDLVVLSACETGKVDPNHTDGISGLSKAFIQAGAKDVIMTLWKVDDNQTTPLIERFYQAVNNGQNNYSDALRESKKEMANKDRHPYYWAGFILNGL